EDLAAIFFTSGTTGQPKGCMITHANLCSQLEVFDDRIPIDATCRLASILPLSHLFELTCGLLYPMARGAAVHYIPSRRGSDIVGTAWRGRGAGVWHQRVLARRGLRRAASDASRQRRAAAARRECPPLERKRAARPWAQRDARLLARSGAHGAGALARRVVLD